jgi:hypothetical protein
LGGAGGKKEFLVPKENQRRDLQKGANDIQRIGNLKGHKVRTVVDGDGMAVLSSKGKEGHKPPLSDIS